jgi:hypothetical protein
MFWMVEVKYSSHAKKRGKYTKGIKNFVWLKLKKFTTQKQAISFANAISSKYDGVRIKNTANLCVCEK